MNKEEKVLEIISGQMESLVTKRILFISEKIKDNLEHILETLEAKIDELLKKAKELQQINALGKIQYIVAEYLLSSMVTKSYEFQLSVYDETLYIGEPCSVYWTIPIVFEDVDGDIEELRNAASKEVLRIHDYEFEGVRKSYLILLHYHLMGLFFAEHLKSVIERADKYGLDFEENTEILYGGYMDQMALLDKLKTE